MAHGGGDPFDGMSHEEMLRWLDGADGETVQAAADKLSAAAEAIYRIADDLKTRPQYVSWRGEGAEAFRTWGNDLAKATIRLGDLGAGSAQWLSRAAEAIARAKAAVPRQVPGALPGAKAAGGSGGSGAQGRTAAAGAEAAFPADKEAARQEAAAEMRKLGQAYQLSGEQMDGLERPVFPVMPAAIVPEDAVDRQTLHDLARPGASDRKGAVPGPVSRGVPAPPRESVSDIVDGSPAPAEYPERLPATVKAPSPGTTIDSVSALPRTGPEQLPETAPTPASGRSGTGGPPAVGAMPPPLATTGGTRVPPEPAGGASSRGGARGRSVTGGVPVAQPRQVTSGGGEGRPGGSSGIVGGRATQTTPTRPVGRVPRGTVVGEGTGGSRTTGHAAAPGGATGQSASGRRSVPGKDIPPGGRVTSQTGGVIGAEQKQPDRSGRLPSGTAAPTRGGISGGVPSKDQNSPNRSGRTPARSAPPAPPRRREREEDERPDDSNREGNSGS